MTHKLDFDRAVIKYMLATNGYVVIPKLLNNLNDNKLRSYIDCKISPNPIRDALTKMPGIVDTKRIIYRDFANFPDINPALFYGSLIDRFPGYTIHSPQIIVSLPGCTEQEPHTDEFPKKIDKFDDNSIICIASCSGNSIIKVWPQSHKIFNGTHNNIPIKPIYVALDKGDCILFLENFVHAGCAYYQENIRLHLQIINRNTQHDLRNGEFISVLEKNIRSQIVKDMDDDDDDEVYTGNRSLNDDISIKFALGVSAVMIDYFATGGVFHALFYGSCFLTGHIGSKIITGQCTSC